MKTFLTINAILISLIMSGCTDSNLASIKSYGNPGLVVCYSGGKEIYSGRSTGKIATVRNSDGWEFMEENTGNFIRVSGDCLIRN